MNKQPNVVFVLTDDQGYGDLGCTGNSIVKTPNIDQFYQESVRLTDFHVGPTCAPTRAGLMTGHYANSTGVWHTVGGRSLLRKNEVTLASALRQAGYRTGIFGKWHLGDTYPYRPMDRGFEETVVHGGGGISQTPDCWGNDYFDDTYYVNGEEKTFKGYCTDVFFSEALDFIKRHKDEPFFCYIATNAPHGPYNVEDTYAKPYQDKTHPERARFYGMITNIDDNFAKLRETLETLNIMDNTIFIFMTDNGTSCGMYSDASGFVVDGYNAGLRGGKNSEYDGGHRVPFFMKWQEGGIGHGKDFDMLAANVDFMPTLLDLCGVTDDSLHCHGMSLAPYLREEKMPEDRVLVTDSQRVAYPVKWRKSAVMTSNWRLVNGRELYAIQEDREQREDVSHQHPDVVVRLRREYDKWWDIVSKQYDSLIPFSIGNQPIQITCHDLRNEECHTAWNQKQIRDGMRIDGYYEVDVETAGDYRFSLRRWPKAVNIPIKEGIDHEDVVFEKGYILPQDWSFYSGGKPLDIAYAEIQIQSQSHVIAIDDTSCEASFVLSLEKGEGRLVCRFLGDTKACVTAAYYVDIEKVG